MRRPRRITSIVLVSAAGFLVLFAIASVLWLRLESDWDRTLFSANPPAIARNLGVTEAESLIRSEPALVILDVRSSREFSGGSRLPNAVHLDPADAGLKEALARLDRSAPHLVYCAGGYRSRKVCGFMKEMEFQKIYNLHRGILSWQFKGKPVIK